MPKPIPWLHYLPEVFAGLRAGESAELLAERCNRFNTQRVLTKNSFVAGMRPGERRGCKDGPLLILLRDRYPEEAEGLIKNFRQQGKQGGQRRTKSQTEHRPKALPPWRRKFSPEQEAAFVELAALPTTPQRFRCPHLVVDPETQEERRCDTLSNKTHCLAHRREGRLWMVQELAETVVVRHVAA